MYILDSLQEGPRRGRDTRIRKPLRLRGMSDGCAAGGCNLEELPARASSQVVSVAIMTCLSPGGSALRAPPQLTLAINSLYLAPGSSDGPFYG